MNKKLFFVILILICIGCTNNKVSDSVKFKREYEKYNNEYLKLDIDEDNIIKYSDVQEINKIISSGTGVIFIGNAKDDISRRVIDILFKVSDSTGLDKIYYIDSLDNIKGMDDISDKKIPIVLFVLDGKIVKYYVGTINDKVDLTSDEEMELYNKYLDGIHEVLQDNCDERC